jgi:hypothetical protein
MHILCHAEKSAERTYRKPLASIYGELGKEGISKIGYGFDPVKKCMYIQDDDSIVTKSIEKEYDMYLGKIAVDVHDFLNNIPRMFIASSLLPHAFSKIAGEHDYKKISLNFFDDIDYVFDNEYKTRIKHITKNDFYCQCFNKDGNIIIAGEVSLDERDVLG